MFAAPLSGGLERQARQRFWGHRDSANPPPKHVGRIVDALQYSVGVEVELLRVAVRRDVFRKAHLQNAPLLAVFVVRSELLDVETLP